MDTPSQQAPAKEAAVLDASTLAQPLPLAGNWLIHPGDNPTYADPAFDDSSWTALNPNSILGDLLPGRHASVIWLRLHLRVDPALHSLALAERDFAPAFETYVNGARVIQVGRVAPFAAYTNDARLIVPISDAQLTSGTLVFAIRIHVTQSQWQLSPPDPTTLLIGPEDQLRQTRVLSNLGDSVFDWLWAAVVLVVCVLALTLFIGQLDRKEYLWTFLLGIAEILQLTAQSLLSFHNYPVVVNVPLLLLGLATDVLLTLVYFGFVRQRVWIWLWVFVAASNLLNAAMQGITALGPMPPPLSMITPAVEFVSGCLPMFILPAMLFLCMRRGNREAGILLIPLFLSNLTDYTNWGGQLLAQIPIFKTPVNNFLAAISNLHAGPVAISVPDITGALCWLSLGAIMVLRSNRAIRGQAQLESQIAAAREVQQVILPERSESVPGFLVESAYLPAQQVGGDFFQVLPTTGNGLFLVVGDVAGKGLPAAMLVSVIVGAIRGVAEYTEDPAELLANLNERLVGRGGGGFSTALAARIDAGGLVTIANAGHLPPYLDGREVELPGALPLGAITGAAYDTAQFELPPGSRLTFYSDGVVEAQNARGELFGFDRTRAISTRSAAAIVEAAKEFGQEDDITVVTVERNRSIAAVA